MLTSTSLIRWCALTAITLILSICGSCVAINRHSDDASVQRAQMQAKQEADKAMWDHMPAPKQ